MSGVGYANMQAAKIQQAAYLAEPNCLYFARMPAIRRIDA